mgnify:CR=1 FL=1
MTTLKQAAQQALEAMETNQYTVAELAPHKVVMKFNDAITALREALAQPEQEPTPWRDMIVVALVREGVNKHRARELADHFAAQRPWIGLTETDWEEIDNKKDTALDSFAQGAVWAADQLKERNT